MGGGGVPQKNVLLVDACEGDLDAESVILLTTGIASADLVG